jgi:hypothetical protein
MACANSILGNRTTMRRKSTSRLKDMERPLKIWSSHRLLIPIMDTIRRKIELEMDMMMTIITDKIMMTTSSEQ